LKRNTSFFAAFVLVFGSLGVLYGLYQFADFWMKAPGTQDQAVFYDVKKNMTPGQIISDLSSLGVITNPRFFYWVGRFTGKLNKFKAGDYRFTTSMKPTEVYGILVSGISYGIPLTVPEGHNINQIAGYLDKIRPGDGSEFLKLCTSAKFIESLGPWEKTPTTLEGFLFPETYLVTRRSPVSELIKQMVKRHRAAFTTEYKERAAEIGFTEYQVVTLASVVEKETGAPQERPMVASVFHNRLKKKMKLQSDPTVIYGIKNYAGNITKKDLLTFHPYNTYVIPALPIGPIGNPGSEAIKAVLYPAESPYLYFVSHNDGTHEFTETYEAHSRAVQKFQIDRKAREGRSWRELSNKLVPQKN